MTKKIKVCLIFQAFLTILGSANQASGASACRAYLEELTLSTRRVVAGESTACKETVNQGNFWAFAFGGHGCSEAALTALKRMKREKDSKCPALCGGVAGVDCGDHGLNESARILRTIK